MFNQSGGEPGFSRCSVKGCKGDRYARGLCGMHYRRVMRHGSTDVPADRRRNTPVLTVEQCVVVRRMDHDFKSTAAIARTLDVSEQTVRKVLRGTYQPRNDGETAA